MNERKDSYKVIGDIWNRKEGILDNSILDEYQVIGKNLFEKIIERILDDQTNSELFGKLIWTDKKIFNNPLSSINTKI